MSPRVKEPEPKKTHCTTCAHEVTLVAGELVHTGTGKYLGEDGHEASVAMPVPVTRRENSRRRDVPHIL